MNNLLTNPSFEGEGNWYHRDGVKELQIPNGWEFWYADESVENPIDASSHSKFKRPEVRVLPQEQLPPHEQDLFVLDGNYTLKIFKGNGAFQCRLFQIKDLLPGQYRLTPKVFGDLVKGYKGNGEKIWADDPDGQDGLIRYAFKTNHWEEEFCGDWTSLVPGRWNDVVFEFYANAATTIGVDFMCPFPLANSGLFCDDWRLEKIEGEPEPSPVPERRYDRVVHLLPQDATDAEIAQVVDAATPSLQSIVWSVDDAFVTAAALLARTVYVWNVERTAADPTTLEAWVERFYPPLPEIVYRSFESAADWEDYLLWQKDPRWRGKNFGSVRYRPLIGSEGCYITALAMAMRIFGLCSEATPVLVDEWLGTEGYTPDTAKALWSAIESELGISIRTGTIQDILQALRRGDLAMAEVLPTSLQHFVLVVDELDAWDFVMLDPYKNLIAPLGDYYDGVESWRILSPVKEPLPPPPPPTKPLKELLTLHLQTPVPGWLDYVAAVKPAWVKLIGNFEAARDIKAVSPDTKVLIRQHEDDNEKYLANPDKYQAASQFLDRFWDSIVANAFWIDAVEGLNETIPTGNVTRIQQAVDFAVVFADELMARCEDANITNIVPCLLNTAVGNPQHGRETRLLVPAARAAVEHGGYIGYHPYFPAHVVHAERWLEEEGYHHHMRALWSWDETFAEHGLKPKYLFTEMGAIGMTVRPDGKPGTYDPEAGWRAALGGDLDRYIRLLIHFRDMINRWNGTHDNRAESLQIFTTGIGIGWKSFLMNEHELAALAAALT